MMVKLLDIKFCKGIWNISNLCANWRTSSTSGLSITSSGNFCSVMSSSESDGGMSGPLISSTSGSSATITLSYAVMF